MSIPKEKPIYVTQPFMPPLEDLQPFLQEIWKNKWLTNNGRFHQEFEEKLCEYLGVKHISLFCNGTLALLTAFQTLKISGEVITTPFSFVATTHSLWWNGLKPVFVDIEPEYFNLDPDKIEAAITSDTSAILPVHVYGNPCKMEKIQRIADHYGLKVIYDACHAFGVKLNGTSVLNAGDLSVLSFHATKVFNTFEGGAIVSHDKKTKERIDFLKNFGFVDEVTVVAPGINAKVNEFQAAFGILGLRHMKEIIDKRKAIAEFYSSRLKDIKGIRILNYPSGADPNYSYYPILIEEKEFGKSRDDVYNLFREQNIFVRRYFYPLISRFPIYKGLISSAPQNLPVAETVSEQVLCLPIYPDLSFSDVGRIVKFLEK